MKTIKITQSDLPFTMKPGVTYEFEGVCILPTEERPGMTHRIVNDAVETSYMRAMRIFKSDIGAVKDALNAHYFGEEPMASAIEEFEKIQKGPVKSLAEQWDEMENNSKLFNSKGWKELGEKLGNIFKEENMKEKEKPILNKDFFDYINDTECDCEFCRMQKEEKEEKKYRPSTIAAAIDIMNIINAQIERECGLLHLNMKPDEETMEKLKKYIENDEKAVKEASSKFDIFESYMKAMGRPEFFITMPKNLGRSAVKEYMNKFYGAGPHTTIFDEMIEAMRREPGGQFTGDDSFKKAKALSIIPGVHKHIECPHCGVEYIPIEELHHVVEHNVSNLIFPIMPHTTLHDSWDCPLCGGQFVGAERLADADDDEDDDE